VWEVYRQFEISTLPQDAAANTTLDVLYTPGSKEFFMPFAADKKAYLKSIGISDEEITTWENNIKTQGDALRAAGINFKSEIIDENEPADANTNTDGSNNNTDVATKSELAFFVKAHADNTAAINGVVTSMTALASTVKTLADDVAALKKPVEERIATEFAARVAPPGAGNTGSVHVATQSKDNVVDPEETKPDLDWFDSVAMKGVNNALGVR
jgi:hypothetical protein